MKLKEKLKNASIDMNQFYKLGMICFLVVAICSTYTHIVTWKFLDIGSKVSGIFRIIFNFGIVFFFKFLKKSSPETKKEEIDMEYLIEKAKF